MTPSNNRMKRTAPAKLERRRLSECSADVVAQLIRQYS
jgi:hypothetical protein